MPGKDERQAATLETAKEKGANELSLDAIAARYRAPLLTFFLRRTNPADAEDLVQETFMRLLRMQDMRSIKNIEAFLFRIAGNLLRDRARHLTTVRKHIDAGVEADKASEVSRPERVLQNRETLQALLQGLDVLSEKTRDIFLLHRLEGMKYAEIAEFYGISASAVEKHMIKALARVATCIADDADR